MSASMPPWLTLDPTASLRLCLCLCLCLPTAPTAPILLPPPTAETQMIEAAGFRGVDYENLTLGVVAIHSGFKL